MAAPTKKVQHLNTGETSNDVPPAKSLAEKLLSIMSEMQGIKKTGTLPGNMSGKPYFTYDDIADKLRVLYKQYGVIVLPSCIDSNFDNISGVSRVTMQYKFVNVDNPEDFEIMSMSGLGGEPLQGKESKTGQLATSMKKAVTSATRYLWKELYLTNDGTDDEPQEEKHQPQQKQTASGNGAANGATKQEEKRTVNRPLDPDTLLRSFNRKRTKNPQPAGDTQTEKAVAAINALCAEDEKAILKDFLGIYDKKDITEGVAAWLLTWIEPVTGEDGKVNVNRFAIEELKIILDYMEKKASI